VTIGVDVGGTTVAAGLVAADGRVLEHRQAPTHARGPGTALETIGDLLERLCEQARVVTGVGIGVPGIVDAERGTAGVTSTTRPSLAWRRSAPRWARAAGRARLRDNDVDRARAGRVDVGRRARGAVARHAGLGTGVGGGIILDGRLHAAVWLRRRVGHVPIDFDGPPCICGGRGCLKAYVSGTDIGLRAGRAARPPGWRGRGLPPRRRRRRAWPTRRGGSSVAPGRGWPSS
jgi:glucokinase